MPKALFIFIFLSVFPYSSEGQTDDISEIDIYRKTFNYHIERYMDSAKYVIEKLDYLKVKSKYQMATLLHLKGVYQLNRRQYLFANNFFLSADSILKISKHKDLALKNKITLGISEIGLKKDKDSLNMFFNDLLYDATKIKDTLSIIDIKHAQALIYKYENTVKAQSVFHEIIEMIESKPNFHESLAKIYSSFGKFYFDLKNFDLNNRFDKSNLYFKKGIELSETLGLYNNFHQTRLYYTGISIKPEEFRKNPSAAMAERKKIFEAAYDHFYMTNNIVGFITALNRLANIKRWEGKTKEAVEFWDKGFKISELENYQDGMRLTASNIVPFAIRIKDFELAEKHALWLQSKYANTDDYLSWRDAEDRLSQLRDAQGDYKSAMRHMAKYYVLRDSVNNKARQNTLNDLETKYQTEKKEQEIALLKSEKELTAQKQKNQRNLLIGGLGITSVAGLFLFVLFKNRQKTNTKLKELDTVKSNFFTNISHEFRTPLTLITNPIEDELEDQTISNTKREKFVMAKRNSDRLLSLVNQLLDLSKIDAGQLKLHIQKGNITQLISALSSTFTYSAKQKEIDYIVDIKPHDDAVYFDKDAIEKIVVNLVSNAVKYTPEKGSVMITSYLKDDHLIVEVKNSGKGLSKPELDHIFQRFYQTSEENQGTGIGLALVKELVELHKGTIKVDSSPNQLTTFTVAIPVNKKSFKSEQFIDAQETEFVIHPNERDQDTVEVEDLTDNEQPILLIVEDNEDLQALIKQNFDASYNVITASNGEIGANLAFEHIPDLIISDIMMPLKDGIELTNELKNDERTSHIPIILLTAKAGEDNELKGIEIGADDYITKPFSSKLLKAKVSKLIETRQKLQSRYSQELILSPKDIAVTNVDEVFLEKVQNVLDKNLVESSFSIEDFSKALGMSRMQLHRKIKALTGLSASEFIRSQRLKLAAQLLKKSDINISQVGYTVGFNDHSYFTKCFKGAYSCTPSDYAKKFS